MILNFSWCLSPAVSCAVLNKGAGFPLPGLPSAYRKHPLNWGPAATAAGLPSPSSLTRCHLSQSERFWIYRKVCLLEKAPTLGELDAVRRPERARMLPGRLRPGLDDAYDGIDFQKPQSKLTRCALVSGLALSVIASRCHLSQSERPWQSAKLPVYTLRPAAARGAEGAALRLHAFAKGSPFGKDSLRPEGDVACATEGGQLARSA